MLPVTDTLRDLLIVAVFLLQQLICYQATLHYNIPEERSQDFLVAHIKSDAELKEGYTPPPVPTQLAILPGQFSQYFTVHPTTGALRVSSHPIDRDRLCGSLTVCVLTLEVAVTVPAEHFHVFLIHVTIDDINDNAPVFQVTDRRRYVTSVLENADVGTILEGIPTAKDTDIGKNGIQSYSLLPQGNINGTFLLRVSEDFEGTLLPVLVVNNVLDREVTDSFDLSLVAYDGGVPPKSGTLKIRVDVIDVNDHTPEFTSTQYNISVREDAPAGTALIQVKATDSDSGRNAEVQYSFSASTRDLYGNFFAINDTSGEVRLKRKFDPSYLDVYGLTVVAKDGGLPHRMTTSKLNVHVLGVNSYHPSIVINAMAPADRKPEISEGLPLRSFVAYVSVSDADRGINSVVECSAKREEDFSLELVHANTYKLISMRIFDREKESTVRANVVCKDAGVPSLTSSAQFDVTINDVNDNTPRFERSEYEANVIENNEIGISLLQLSAHDDDDGDNARISYSLIEYGDDSDNKVRDTSMRSKWLNIDPQSGIIYTSARFDHEIMTSYRVRVIAEDNGQPRTLSSTALLIIRVDNVNDIPPMFTQSSFSFGIFENLPPGLEVGTVSASDMDAPPFNQILYNLFDPDTSSIHSLFNVDSTSGRITTVTPLDREKVSVYYIRAVAIDAKNSSLASTASATIYIADKNDNAPIIDFPNEYNNTIEVSTHAPKGYLICRVLAHDLDIGANAKVRFSIKRDGTPDMTATSLFGIDANNGAVYVDGRLDDGSANDISLIIEASDQGSPRLSATAVLNIKLNDSEALAAEMYLLSARSQGSNPGRTGWFGLDYDDSTQQMIIIILAGVTGTLAIILIVAIIYIRHCRQKQQGVTKNGAPPSTKNYQTAAAGDLRETTFVSNVAYEASLSRDLGMSYDASSDFKVDDYELNCAVDCCGQILNQHDVTSGLNNHCVTDRLNNHDATRPQTYHDSSLPTASVSCRGQCCELLREPCNSLSSRRPINPVSLKNSPALRCEMWNSLDGSYKNCGCSGKGTFSSPAHNNIPTVPNIATAATANSAVAARYNDPDMDNGSACTTNLSNSDSGRGHSEEEDPSAILHSSILPSFILPSSKPRTPLIASSPISSTRHSGSTWSPRKDCIEDPEEGYYSNQLALTTFKPPQSNISGHRSSTWQHPSGVATRSPARQHIQGRYGRSMEDIKGPCLLRASQNEMNVANSGQFTESGEGEEGGQIWLPRHAAPGSGAARYSPRKPPSGASGRRRQGAAPLRTGGLEVDVDELCETSPMSQGVEHSSTYAHGV